MTLLSIVKSVMDSNGWPDIVSSVSSSQDQNMRQAFALANKTLRSISYKKNWPILVREHTFATVQGQVEYPLPDDFHHMVVPSAVDSDKYYHLKGSLTPIQWYRMALNGAVNWASGFRLDPFTSTFNVAPTPSGGNNLVFMYVTNLIAVTSGGTPATQYTQDSDVALVDEEVIEAHLSWRWRQKKGLDYTAELAEANSLFNSRFAQQYGLGELAVGGHSYYEQWPLTPGFIGVNPVIGG